MSAFDLPLAPSRSVQDLTVEALDAVDTVLALTADLDARQQQGPMIPIVNPALWEVGHVGWFFEKWTLRNLYEAPSMVPHSDALYDSAAIAHDTRWRLSFPSWEDTRAFARKTARDATDRLRHGEPDALEQYFIQLATLHTDMHAEAFTYTRQTLGFPEPMVPSKAAPPPPQLDFEPHDIAVPRGTFTLGAVEGEQPFVFDNEKWGHEVSVEPFAMAATAVSNGEFLRFVESGGYRDRSYWTDEGWWWKQALGAEHPVYWRRESDGGWLVRRYDAWVPIDPHAAIIHVNWHEASAYCAWAGRRLPAEAEWELGGGGGRRAALRSGATRGATSRRQTTGRTSISRGRGTVDVRAFPRGRHSPWDAARWWATSWEWTATDVRAVPGFRRRSVQGVLRALVQRTQGASRRGMEYTRGRLIRNTWRNFYPPDRRDVMCGFRTCAA